MYKERSFQILVILVCICLSLTCCMTTRTSADGTTTKQIDLETTIAITQLALSSAEHVYAMYQQYSAQQLQIDQAEKDRQDAQRAAQVQKIKDTLQTLIELRNQYVAGTAK